MQEFFMDYGLWLLVGLLVVIALVFLLSGRRKAEQPIEPPATVEPTLAPAPVPFVDPIIAAPVATAPVVAEPIVVEPVARAAEVAPEPVPESQPAPEPVPVEPAPAPVAATPDPIPVSPAVAAVETAGDDLLRLKGVGPKLKALLIDLGVTSYAQIAGWTDADIAAIDTKLGTFKGRPVRDQWVDQAKYLAAGDIVGFEAKYGKI
jgi:predicted flap endonuclease-1-like 5' DNA nuclease